MQTEYYNLDLIMKSEIEFLYNVLGILQGYLQDLILIGGFAALLYRFHEDAKEIGIPHLITYDVDLASEGEVPIRGEKSIHESLEEAGLRRELMGNAEQPIVKYYPQEEMDAIYYVEFLVPLFGSATKRNRKPKLTHSIQKHLPAQKLRYLDLLLYKPWGVHTASLPTLKDLPDLVVKVPHPGMYIMQKVLTLQERKRSDRIKDFAYIYQTLFCFRKNLTPLASQYANLIVKTEWKRWYSKFIRLVNEKFGSQVSEGSIEASHILDEVTPEMVSAAVMRFIDKCPGIE